MNGRVFLDKAEEARTFERRPLRNVFLLFEFFAASALAASGDQNFAHPASCDSRVLHRRNSIEIDVEAQSPPVATTNEATAAIWQLFAVLFSLR